MEAPDLDLLKFLNGLAELIIDTNKGAETSKRLERDRKMNRSRYSSGAESRKVRAISIPLAASPAS